jgi:hypothetical protein
VEWISTKATPFDLMTTMNWFTKTVPKTKQRNTEAGLRKVPLPMRETGELTMGEDSREEQKRNQQAEFEFRPHLQKYLEATGHIDRDWMMTNFLIITSQVNLQEDDISAISWSGNYGLQFWQQGGMLEYAKQRWNSRALHNGEEGL